MLRGGIRPGSEKKVKARASSLRKRKAVSRSSQIIRISVRKKEATVKRFCLGEVGEETHEDDEDEAYERNKRMQCVPKNSGGTCPASGDKQRKCRNTDGARELKIQGESLQGGPGAQPAAAVGVRGRWGGERRGDGQGLT